MCSGPPALRGTAYLVHVLRRSLCSQFRAKRAQGKLPLLAALCFAMNIESIEIEDPIEHHTKGAIEVLITTSAGEKRWCFFFTPAGMAACGDWIPGTNVRFHYGASHMILVSEISENIIESVLRNIASRGELEKCTVSLG